MIILSLLNGSRLYKTNTEDSDWDIINVYVKDRKDYYFNQIPKNKYKRFKSVDYEVMYVDFIHFCHLLIKGNPNIVIPIYKLCPMHITPAGGKLVTNAYYLYDRNNIEKAFDGMCMSLEKTFEGRKTRMRIDFIQKMKDDMLRTLPKDKTTDYRKAKEVIDDILHMNHVQTL